MADKSLISEETRRCPFDFYKNLRTTEPVAYLPELDAYAVSTYDLIQEVTRNPEIFSNKGPKKAGGAKTAVNYCPAADELVTAKGLGRMAPTLANNDPPTHTAYRRLAQEAFRPTRIRQMGDYVSALTEELLDKIEGKREFDVIQELAIPLPMFVIADQIGVDRADFEKYKAWSEAYLYYYRPPKSDEALMQDAALVVEAQTYMQARMAERRVQPREDVLSDLVAAKFEGERLLTDKEIMSMLEFILVAGNETTTNGIGNGLWMMATQPELQKKLRADLTLIPKFVEECLRVESPAQALMRTTTQETVLGGVTIPADKQVLVMYASANRDEGQFANATEVDFERTNGRTHMAFGYGIHMCVGSELARLEMKVAFDAFLRRVPQFELAAPTDSLQYHYMYAARGLTSLPLRVVGEWARAAA